jgi:hypothetical protein
MAQMGRVPSRYVQILVKPGRIREGTQVKFF